MPQNEAQWALFTFFAIGALGGWFVLAIFAYETWKTFTRGRPRKLKP